MIDNTSANFAIFRIRIATRYKAMGAVDTVNAVDDSLTDQQKAKLTKVLAKRRGQLQKAIDDVDKAIKRLKTGKKSAKRKRRSY
jgi:hypothetical protein